VSGADLAGKTFVVTGASSGIGLETARDFARRGARVVLAARDSAKGEAARRDIVLTTKSRAIELVLFDLGSLAQVRRGAREILAAVDRIDVLVNNAGLIQPARRITVDGFETTFAVNHLGPFLLTNLLLERMRATASRPGSSARIVNVAARAHWRCPALRFEDPMFERGFYRPTAVYNHSKLANISFTRELAWRLEGSGVTANALHPGVVRSGFGAGGDLRGPVGWAWQLIQPLLLSPEAGARTSIFCATSPEVARLSGKYFDSCIERSPSRAARDDAAAKRLWTLSEHLTGLQT
jgi:retinol dehydrogenase-12